VTAPRRVVVADSEQEVRDAVADALAARAFDVVHAANGLEALLAVKREAPYAVVLDITMPRLGGVEALKRIREFRPATRIVVYSSRLEPDVEQRALAAGAAAVLTKPCAAERLVEAVDGEAPAPGPSLAERGGSRDLRILLIDDDPRVNGVLTEMLAGHGARVFPVTNAADAFQLLTYGAPDAIFLDIGMPGLSGIEALPTIRALAPDAKVVMVSGIADEETVKQTLAAGAFDYMAKPIDFARLGRTLEAIRATTAPPQ
jgi:CheY-like chemotaxis protein